MKLNRCCWQVMIGLALLDACQVLGAETSGVVISDGLCSVTIHPETLAVALHSERGREIVVSEAQAGLGPARDIRTFDTRAEWTLRDGAVAVSMSLNDGALTAQIRSNIEGSFTWPVLALSAPVNALIWPYWEGRFIPLDDPEWRAFLTRREWDTLEGLCMPFWGLYSGDFSVTYIVTNRYNNRMAFDDPGGRLQARFTHAFPRSRPDWVYGLVIRLSESASPVEPARHFRKWLIDRGEFVPMSEKLKQTPKAARLLGAPHIYLWGDGMLTRHDIPRARWRDFCRTLAQEAGSDRPSVGRRLRAMMEPESWKQVKEITTLDWPYDQIMSEVTSSLSRLLTRPDFFDAEAWARVDLPPEAKQHLAAGREALPEALVCRMNALLLRAAYPDFLAPVDTWGDGVSVKMLRRLKEAGLDRARLCLAGWEGVEQRPEVARVAEEMGYLFGTYDSFHSIHDPALAGTDATWSTAQFDRDLFETGPIVRRDGGRRAGFKGQGYLLSPHAARPWVERRVRRNMARVPYSYYFVDCDAFGQVFDDYAPGHPSTQEQDAAARVDRLAWIRDTFGVAIGSEGGSSYAAPAVHVMEGILTPVIGWGDPDMKDRNSKHYLGGYYPPDGPQVFIRPVPLKEEYVRRHYDPRFRLPLNEIVFHDSFVSTHHWSAGSLKFTNVRDATALFEMLYQCPPLYHLNLSELDRHRGWIHRQYEAFSPVHREIGFEPMTDFAWLTPDRRVQRTVFGGRVEIIANFGEEDYATHDLTLPAGNVRVLGLKGVKPRTYVPGP